MLEYNPFRRGAQNCREMMARFVEQGGTETERNIAASIRANWHPGWGDDPGPPDSIADTWELAPNPHGERLRKRMSERGRGSKAALRRTARMLEKWGPVVDPANDVGQVSFTRSMMDCTAEAIRAFLRKESSR